MSHSGATVIVNEVGLRDGLQNEPTHVSTESKLHLARMLVEAGIRYMEATSFVSSKAVPQMADADELFRRLPDREGSKYSALIPNERGYERAVAAGAKRVAVVLSATETMNRKNIRRSLDETRAVCRQLMERSHSEEIWGIAYIAVAFECPYEGPVSPSNVIAMSEEMFRAGAEEVVIADTIGAANPSKVHDLFGRLCAEFQPDRLAGHFHDTRALALANAWAALQVGIHKFDSSIGGLGGCPFAPGAAGNVATEDLVLMLEQCGYDTGIQVEKLLPAIREGEQIVGHKLGGRMLDWLKSDSSRKRLQVATRTVS